LWLAGYPDDQFGEWHVIILLYKD